MSVGAIVGIVIGVIIAVAVIVGVIVFFVVKSKKSKSQEMQGFKAANVVWFIWKFFHLSIYTFILINIVLLN